MTHQITATVPDTQFEALNVAARGLNQSRAEVIRMAINSFLEEFTDATVAARRLEDANDAVLDWAKVRRELLDSN